MRAKNTSVDNKLLAQRMLKYKLEELFDNSYDDLIEIKSRDDYNRFILNLFNYDISHTLIENSNDVFEYNNDSVIQYLSLAS